jgi:hypothetical protein
LPPKNTQRTLVDFPVLTGALFEPDDRYRIVRETVMAELRQVRDELAQLYCQDNGRPGTEPVLLLAVTWLQFMEKAPDRKAAENVRLHLGWKYALEWETDDTGFDRTGFTRFRGRWVEGGATPPRKRKGSRPSNSSPKSPPPRPSPTIWTGGSDWERTCEFMGSASRMSSTPMPPTSPTTRWLKLTHRGVN